MTSVLLQLTRILNLFNKETIEMLIAFVPGGSAGRTGGRGIGGNGNGNGAGSSGLGVIKTCCMCETFNDVPWQCPTTAAKIKIWNEPMINMSVTSHTTQHVLRRSGVIFQAFGTLVRESMMDDYISTSTSPEFEITNNRG